MFDEEYFPTPIGIVKRMIYPLIEKEKQYRGYDTKVFKNKTILEPSAGAGHILDGITNDSIPYRDEEGNVNNNHKRDAIKLDNCQIYCIEQNPELKHVLLGKGYKVIADDFLAYNGDYLFDMILMNPPFSNADEHLLKAWQVLHHGDIVCLVNSETIKNPYSEKRKLVAKLIADYGTVEHLGSAFSKSERPTDVQVSLIRLHKPKGEDKFDFNFEEVTKEKKYVIDEETIKDAPAIKDVIGNMMLQYDMVKKSYIDYIKFAEQLDFYGQPLIKRKQYKEDETDIFKLAHHCYTNNKSKHAGFNAFCDGMKENMWRIVFDNLNNISSFNMERFMTNSVRQNFSEFVQRQGYMDFTKENVWNIIQMLFDNKTNILEKCITEVFDIFTKYHAENRCYVEGWKTNDKWKVNRKVIIPRAVDYGKYTNTYDLKKYGDRFHLNYHTQSEYTDIDKAMDYITGHYTYNSLFSSLQNHFQQLGTIKTNDKFENSGTSFYFDWKFWKKGTLHITFKNVKLWEQFNIRACAGKRWLPEAEQKAYEDSLKKKTESTQQKTNQQQLLLIE